LAFLVASVATAASKVLVVADEFPAMRTLVAALEAGSIDPQLECSLVSQDDLPADLQCLPQDGNLLPLLQQVAGDGAYAGADPRALLQNIAAVLQRSGSPSGQQLAEHIQQALQQLTSGEAIPAGVIPPELAALVAAERGVQGAPAGLADASGRPLPQLADPLRPTAGGATEQGRVAPEAVREQQSVGATKLPETLLQLSPETGPRTAEALSLLAALRHPASSLKPAAGSATVEPTVSGAAPQTPLPATGATGSGAAASVSVDVPVQQGNWDQALGERIQWLMGQRLQGAQIKLNPAHLGPLEVRIQMQQDQASIQFTSNHAVVREVLEAALPRLRDMFESAGVQLLDVNVSGQSLAQQQRAPQERAAPALQHVRNGGEEGAETVLESRVDSLLAMGRLDLFA
jgi:flagellar hook-length control protein FliK